MMLNTDMGMVFDQNKELADCKSNFKKTKKGLNWMQCNKKWGGNKNK